MSDDEEYLMMKTCIGRAARLAWRGALGGAVATVAMSAVVEGGRALGLLRTPPPKQITAELAEVATVITDAWPPAASPAFRAGWLTAHLLYGAACGVLFSQFRRAAPGVPRRPFGLGFGLLVWAVSYLGLMPSLRLYPWPGKDTPGRIATMIVAHLVFGASLAEADARLAPHA